MGSALTWARIAFEYTICCTNCYLLARVRSRLILQTWDPVCFKVQTRMVEGPSLVITNPTYVTLHMFTLSQRIGNICSIVIYL